MAEPITQDLAKQYNQDEYNLIKDYLPPEYINIPLDDIPNNVRTTAWIKYMDVMDESGYSMTARKQLSEIINFRHNRSGFDINSPMARSMIDLAYRTSGSGGYYNWLQTFLYSLDKYGSIRLPPNVVFNGPMFITRPRLCLQTSNLRNHRVMAALDTMEPNSMAFMIRALLDTNLDKANPVYKEAYQNSSVFDYQNPFLTPLCNAVTSVSGLPDLLLETATTQGGFMAEAQQFVTGGDNLHRASYQLHLTFRDTQHGPIAAILYYWIEYIRCVVRGYMMAYADDIDQQRLNYTVSLYLFNLDPSRKYITHWCKCTGCFPTAFPMGAIMSRESNGAFVKAASELSIPFVCNVVEYMDPNILMDFNKLVTRYCKDINTNHYNQPMEPDVHGRVIGVHKHPPLPDIPALNFTGLPYVTSDPYGMRLEWRLMERHATATDLNIGLLEMLMENKVFSVNGDSFLKPVNEYYYPGFSGTSDKFKTDQFIKHLDDVIAQHQP